MGETTNGPPGFDYIGPLPQKQSFNENLVIVSNFLNIPLRFLLKVKMIT